MTDAYSEQPPPEMWEHPGQANTTVMHRYARQPSRLNVKLERNSRGYTWEISYSDESLDAVLDRIAEANDRLTADYGNDDDAPVKRTYRR